MRRVPIGRACDNLCLSCLETTQTCSTVSHCISPTDSEGLASIVFLQADTNNQCLTLGETGTVGSEVRKRRGKWGCFSKSVIVVDQLLCPAQLLLVCL